MQGTVENSMQSAFQKSTPTSEILQNQEEVQQRHSGCLPNIVLRKQSSREDLTSYCMASPDSTQSIQNTTENVYSENSESDTASSKRSRSVLPRFRRKTKSIPAVPEAQSANEQDLCETGQLNDDADDEAENEEQSIHKRSVITQVKSGRAKLWGSKNISTTSSSFAADLVPDRSHQTISDGGLERNQSLPENESARWAFFQKREVSRSYRKIGRPRYRWSSKSRKMAGPAVRLARRPTENQSADDGDDEGGDVDQDAQADKANMSDGDAPFYRMCLGGARDTFDDSSSTSSTEDLNWSVQPPGMVGLANLGNTCFINTAIQCLRATPFLYLHLLRPLHDTTTLHASKNQDRECMSLPPTPTGRLSPLVDRTATMSFRGKHESPYARSLDSVVGSIGGLPGKELLGSSTDSSSSKSTSQSVTSGQPGASKGDGSHVERVQVEVNAHGDCLQASEKQQEAVVDQSTPKMEDPTLRVSTTATVAPVGASSALCTPTCTQDSAAHTGTPHVQESSPVCTESTCTQAASTHCARASVSSIATPASPVTEGDMASTPRPPFLTSTFRPPPQSSTSAHARGKEGAEGSLRDNGREAAESGSVGEAGQLSLANSSRGAGDDGVGGGSVAGSSKDGGDGVEGGEKANKKGAWYSRALKLFRSESKKNETVLEEASKEGEQVAGDTEAAAQADLSVVDESKDVEGTAVSNNAAEKQEAAEEKVEEPEDSEQAANVPGTAEGTDEGAQKGQSQECKGKGSLLAPFQGLIESSCRGDKATSGQHLKQLYDELKSHPIGQDYCNGGQHDCKEVIEVLIDLLHSELANSGEGGTEGGIRGHSGGILQRRGSVDSTSSKEGEGGEEVAGGFGYSGTNSGEAEEGVREQSGAQAPPLSSAMQSLDEATCSSFTTASPPTSERNDDTHTDTSSHTTSPTGSEASRASMFDDARSLEQQHAFELRKAHEQWSKFTEKSSILQRKFMGQLQSSVVCDRCSNRFTTYEPFLDLSLPLTREGKKRSPWLPSKYPTTLEECLRVFTNRESLSGNELFHCTHCDDRVTATKLLRIHRFPSVLVLHIKRFKFSARNHEKINANIQFPLTGLQLAGGECSLASDECGMQSAKYDCFAVCNHSGSVQSGHYTAYCKVKQKGGKDEWVYFNDSQHTIIPPDRVQTCHAYILFYQLRRDWGGEGGSTA